MRLSLQPNLTNHATQRGEERLQLKPDSLVGWISATWRDWLPINAEWLRVRGVKCSARGVTWFATPFTAYRGVAIAVTPDNAIRTIITFAEVSKLADAINGHQKETTQSGGRFAAA